MAGMQIGDRICLQERESDGNDFIPTYCYGLVVYSVIVELTISRGRQAFLVSLVSPCRKREIR